MGKQMASVLIKKGADVAVWNRTASKCSELVAAGATLCSTPAEVVDSCDVTHAMLADPAASEAVVFGDGGALSAFRADKSYIEHSTIDEATCLRMSEAITTMGARFLAAPVSGGWRDAAKGELLFIAGGDRSLFEEAAAEGSSIHAMSHRNWFVSDCPAGATRAKLMLQIMMGTMVGALAETLSLTEKAGLDPSQVLEMYNSSAMANPISAAKGKLMISKDYKPNFQIYLQQKDLRLALDLADQLGVPAPISAAVNAQYVSARQMGYAGADFAAVREVYEKGVPPKDSMSAI